MDLIISGARLGAESSHIVVFFRDARLMLPGSLEHAAAKQTLRSNKCARAGRRPSDHDPEA
ncbi:hypothetical protein ABIB85_007534 [Bradyrhizobium sp. JR1.5]|uniref:hypothetical protein n=1 Tax=unclassified Bradyrhizobium TaxID=2631580 RepID=UPI0033938AC5